MVEPVTPLTPRPVRFASVGQWWREVTFVHWAVAPETVAHPLPRGTQPDTFDGLAYVGLVPFLMHPIGGQVGQRPPSIGTFRATNVHPRSVDGQDRREAVVPSSDANQLDPVPGAQIPARLQLGIDPDSPPPGENEVPTPIVPRRADGPSLERSTTGELSTGGELSTENEEGVAASRMTWALVRERTNDHPPWLLQKAERGAGVVAAAGLGDPTGPPASVLHSPGVPVRSGLPSAVGK